MNRAQVLERLNLGRVVEAELLPDPAGRRAFVEVRPVLDSQRAYLAQSEPSIEPVLVHMTANANAVIGFQVRCCRLNAGWEVVPDDWDRFVYHQESFHSSSIEDLEQGIHSKYGLSIESLQIPGSTESPL